MSKKKLLLALITSAFMTTAGAFALVGCSDGNTDKNDNENTGNTGDSNDKNPGGDNSGNSACKHTEATEVTAKAATCTVNGNRAYWYCANCNKYFTDAAFKTETTLSAVTLTASGHSLGNLVPADEQPCNGLTESISAHYRCSECHVYFDEEKDETTLSALSYKNHDFTHFDAVEPTYCTDGNIEYWYCGTCLNAYNNASGSGAVLASSEIFTAARHSLTAEHRAATASTCHSTGNTEYWHCATCDKYYDDAKCDPDDETERADTVVAIDASNHVYEGAYAYNYGNAQYERACAGGAEHAKDVQVAGSQSYPYLVNNDKSLIAAYLNGGFIRLTDDIDLREDETVDNAYYVTLSDVTIDLNNHTIITRKGFRAGEKNNDAEPVLTVKNGTLNRDSFDNPTTNIAALSATGHGKLIVDDCTVTTDLDTAISIFDYGKIEAKDSRIYGVYYGVASNAGTGNYSDELYVKLTDCDLDAHYAGLLWNVPGKMEVTGGTVSGYGQGVIARGGDVTLTDVEIIKRTSREGDKPSALTFDYSQFESKKWGSGNSVPGYALVVGNRADSYQYATNLVLSGVTITDQTGADKCVYAYGNTNKTAGEDAYGATVTYDQTSNFGEVAVVYGDADLEDGSTVTVNGYTLVANKAQLTAAIEKGGNIMLINDIETTAAIAVGGDAVIVIDLQGKTITSPANAFNISGNASLTVNGGTVTATAKGFDLVEDGALTLNDVIVNGAMGIWSRSSGTLSVSGGEINTSSYAMLAGPDPLTYIDTPAYKIDVNVTDTLVNVTGDGVSAFCLYVVNATMNNVTINARCVGVQVFRDSTLVMTDCTLAVETDSAIMGNGTVETGSNNCGINTNITLNNCTVTNAVVAVYLPQTGGTTVINGGSYTGSHSAVEVRAGSLELNGATLNCTGTEFKAEANGNGHTVNGAALAVSQHTTNDEINVTVNGSDLTGIYAVYEADVQDNLETNKIFVTLGEGNTFNGGIYSENCDNLKALEKPPVAA